MTLEALVDASYQDEATYPHLGFNPAPGIPADVEALENALAKTTGSMQEAGRLLGEMRSAGSGVWVGAAADAFRSHFDDSLVTELEHAQQSLTGATGVIQNWYKDLTGFKQTAQSLDQEAAAARETLTAAQQKLSAARGNPNLGLAGREFDSAQLLQQAQSALDQAEAAVNDAQSAEQQAQDELNSILQRAQQLAQETESAARNYASQLENATKDLAPHKPGFFSSMFSDFTSALKSVGNWVEQHANAIHSICSTISAIAGLVALCTPPPIDVVAGAVALVAGAGALAMDMANPKTRDAIGGILTGHESAANWKAAAGVGLDALSVIPGVGVIKSAVTGEKAAMVGLRTIDAGLDGAESIPSIASKIPGLAKLGEGAADSFVDAARASGSGLGNAAYALSEGVHSLSLPVKLIGVGASKVMSIGRDADDVFQISKAAAQNMQFAWKAKSVATNLYSDVKDLF
jgi:hypothetical protein